MYGLRVSDDTVHKVWVNCRELCVLLLNALPDAPFQTYSLCWLSFTAHYKSLNVFQGHSFHVWGWIRVENLRSYVCLHGFISITFFTVCSYKNWKLLHVLLFNAFLSFAQLKTLFRFLHSSSIRLKLDFRFVLDASHTQFQESVGICVVMG